jgi:L-malate glycosyltransferase
MAKRIAHVLKDLDLGGIQTLLLDTLTHCAENNIPHNLICIGGGELEAEFSNPRFNTVFFPKRLPYVDPLIVLKIRRYIRKNNIEELHCHHTSEGITAWLATRGLQVKVLQYFHVSPLVSNRQDNLALKFMSRMADVCIAPSAAQRDALQNAGYSTKNMHVVHNGIHPGRLRPQTKRDIRSELGIGKDQLFLVSIGNFYNKTRDQETICRALPEFLQRYPDARFAFYGGHTNRYTPHSPGYEKCVEICKTHNIVHKVFFPGRDADIANILTQADIFVYASLGDTFGMAVAEAMMSGVPVVANNLPVLMEVMEKYTYTYPTGDDGRLCDVLCTIANDMEAAKKKAVDATNFAEGKYGVGRFVGVVGDEL